MSKRWSLATTCGSFESAQRSELISNTGSSSIESCFKTRASGLARGRGWSRIGHSDSALDGARPPYTLAYHFVPTHLQNEKIKAVPDSGASGNYLTVNCNVTNKRVAKKPISVRLPNNQLIKNTHEEFLPIPVLPESARLALFFYQLISASLISIEKLCYAGCKAIFEENIVRTTKDGKT